MRLTALQRGLLIAGILSALAIHNGRANAMGWYDSACCSNRDCEQLSDTAVTIEEGGYRVRYVAKLGLKIHVLVPFSEAKPSRDGHYHGCANTVKFLCLYVPVNA